MSGLTQEDRDELMAAGYVEFIGDAPGWTARLEDLDAPIEAIVARHVKAALTEAAWLMSAFLHDPECAQCDDVRECISVALSLADSG